MERRTILRATLKSILLGSMLLVVILYGAFQCLAEEGEYAGTIVFGDETAYTGAYASAGIITAQGAEDFWKQHNHCIIVKGKKYKVPHRMLDFKTDVSQSVANFNRFVAQGAVLVRTIWSPGMVAMFPLAKKARVPVICNGFNKDVLYPPTKYMYSISPSYPGILCAGVKWYKENKWKGSGKMKVALLLWDNAYGRGPHLPETYGYLKEDLGVEVLPSEFFPVNVKDFTPILLRLKKKGVDLIYFQGLHTKYALLAKDAMRLGMTPKLGLMCTLWSLTEHFIKLAGDAGEGCYGLWQFYLDPRDDNPSLPVVQKFRDAMEKYRGNRYYPEVLWLTGWMHEYVCYHALKITLEKYGFPITGEQVGDCLSNMGAWDWGLSRVFTGYSGGDRLGLHEVRVHQVKEGKVILVSDWIPEPVEFVKRAPWVIGKKSVKHLDRPPWVFEKK